MSRWQRYLTPFATTLLVIGLARAAMAHVRLDRAEPKVGSTVACSPNEIKVYFDGEVAPALCCVQVFDSNGNQVDKKDTHLGPKDDTCVIVSVPTLAAGTYKVVWCACCVDDHKTRGNFKFDVTPGDEKRR